MSKRGLDSSRHKAVHAFILFCLSFTEGYAAEVLTPGEVSKLIYDDIGLTVQLSLLDGSAVTTTESCGSNDVFRLSSTHANYKVLVGALVSAEASSSSVTLSLAGCQGSDSLITSLQIGTTPAPPVAGTPNLMSSNVITGTGAFQEFHTNIDAINNEAMVITRRIDAPSDWAIFDTQRGAGNYLRTNSVSTQQTDANGLTSFLNTGHAASGSSLTNALGGEYFHLSLQSKEGFFDVVRYTGTGGTQTINHNLNHDVGMIWVKNMTTGNFWMLWHRSYSVGQYVNLNVGNATTGNDTSVFNTLPTTSAFSVGGSANVNTSGDEYVAYLFAHNPANQTFAGRYTGTGSAGNFQNIGFQPQLFIMKDVTGATPDTRIVARSIEPGSNPLKKWYRLNSSQNDAPASFGIVFEENGFSFERSSGNWAGSDIIFFAIGEPQ